MKYELASLFIVCILLISVVGCSDEVPVQQDSSPNSRDETNPAEDVDSAPSPDSEAQPVEETPLEIEPIEEELDVSEEESLEETALDGRALDGEQTTTETPIRIFPVEGIVTYQGKPVVGIELVFSPIDKGRPSYGMTDNNGRFIMCYSISIEGVQAGRHDVTFEYFDDNVEDSSELTPAIKAILNAHGENCVPLPIEITGEIKDLQIELPLE